MNTRCQPTLRIRLLGTVSIHGGDGPEMEVRSRSAALLLARLAGAPNPLRRESLIDALFPEQDPEAGRARLRQCLYLLRQDVASLGLPAEELLPSTRDTLRLAPVAETDVARFCDLLDQATSAGPGAGRRDLLTQAVAAYGGEFLPGHFDDWTLAERERLQERYVGALCDLAEELSRLGDHAAAITRAREAVQVDSLREESHRMLMAAYGEAGRAAEAERHYRELEQLLQEEMGLPPAAATQQVRDEIRRRAGESPAAPPPAKALAGEPEIPQGPPRLPRPVNHFFGRAEEMVRVERWLAGQASPGAVPNPLVTLTGPGGIGKTRLALEIAHRLEPWFAGAVWFVSLEAVSGSGFLPALFEALCLSPAANPSLEAIEVALRRPRGSLLVLDNFDHLEETAALQLQDLRTRIPNLACLVTSRRRLHLRGEQELVLAPLPLPEAGAGTAEQLSSFPGIQLFVDRARSARATFELTEENAPTVASLCRRLDGLPLALELGASWLSVLSTQQALERLQRGAALVSRERDVPSRHRSLQAALDSSYELLSPEQRRLFRRLGVFRDGWTLDAAEALCGGLPGSSGDVLEDLSVLVDRSLVQVDERNGLLRYRLLETLREYACGRAREAGEDEVDAAAHAHYYCAFAAAHCEGKSEPDAQADAELENLREALTWLSSQPGQHEARMCLAASLAGLAWVRGRLDEGWSLLQPALESAPRAPSWGRLRLLEAASLLLTFQGEYATAHDYLQEARQVAEGLADPALRCRVAVRMALVELVADRTSEARRWLEEAEELNCRLRDEDLGIFITYQQASLAQQEQRTASARQLFEHCVSVSRRRGKRRHLADALSALGWTYRDDNPAAGEALVIEAISLHREISHPHMEISSLMRLAALRLRAGSALGARAALLEAVERSHATHSTELLYHALESLALLEATDGDPSLAARLFGAAENRAGRRDWKPETFRGPRAEALWECCRTDYAVQWQQGREMTPSEAVALARRCLAPE